MTVPAGTRAMAPEFFQLAQLGSHPFARAGVTEGLQHLLQDGFIQAAAGLPGQFLQESPAVHPLHEGVVIGHAFFSLSQSSIRCNGSRYAAHTLAQCRHRALKLNERKLELVDCVLVGADA